jgi:hypothetical protein
MQDTKIALESKGTTRRENSQDGVILLAINDVNENSKPHHNAPPQEFFMLCILYTGCMKDDAIHSIEEIYHRSFIRIYQVSLKVEPE